jgi:hypothetical protein
MIRTSLNDTSTLTQAVNEINQSVSRARRDQRRAYIKDIKSSTPGSITPGSITPGSITQQMRNKTRIEQVKKKRADLIQRLQVSSKEKKDEKVVTDQKSATPIDVVTKKGDNIDKTIQSLVLNQKNSEFDPLILANQMYDFVQLLEQNENIDTLHDDEKAREIVHISNLVIQHMETQGLKCLNQLWTNALTSQKKNQEIVTIVFSTYCTFLSWYSQMCDNTQTHAELGQLLVQITKIIFQDETRTLLPWLLSSSTFNTLDVICETLHSLTEAFIAPQQANGLLGLFINAYSQITNEEARVDLLWSIFYCYLAILQNAAPNFDDVKVCEIILGFHEKVLAVFVMGANNNNEAKMSDVKKIEVCSAAIEEFLLHVSGLRKKLTNPGLAIRLDKLIRLCWETAAQHMNLLSAETEESEELQMADTTFEVCTNAGKHYIQALQQHLLPISEVMAVATCDWVLPPRNEKQFLSVLERELESCITMAIAKQKDTKDSKGPPLGTVIPSTNEESEEDEDNDEDEDDDKEDEDENENNSSIKQHNYIHRVASTGAIDLLKRFLLENEKKNPQAPVVICVHETLKQLNA